ncbi:MAG: diguanylate cyclase [Pseudomonadota bacterium]
MSQLSNSFKTPTMGEVESSFSELDEAIIGHGKWLTEWNTRVVCGIPVEDKYTSEKSYRESCFGRWYYAKHADFLNQNPGYIAIDKLHRTVHAEMSAIVKKVNSGKPVTRDDYKSFIDAEGAFSESIINLRDDLFKLLLSFDHLTGALNRQAFFHILEQEHARIIRFGDPGCIVMLDIDKFKNVNDKFGHAAGDKVLVSIANFIIENMRPYDSICRYGGEEFLICMPETTIEVSHRIIERIREKLSQENICVSNDHCIKVSASFGVAPMSATEKLKDTIEYADRALYQAKVSGRNKVVIWTKDAEYIA